MTFYRYDNITSGGEEIIVLREFNLLRETLKGYWITSNIHVHWTNSEDIKKWVSKTARKRHAYPTKEEALSSFLARKRMQIKILIRQLKRAEEGKRIGLSYDIKTDKWERKVDFFQLI